MIFILNLFISLALASEQDCINQKTDILEKLKCLQDIASITEVTSSAVPLDARQFEIAFTQPVDHTDLALGTFTQRIALIHRNVAEPMVLQTSGYSIFYVREAAITRMFETNQIQIEHRFFSGSTPQVLDWSKLNIKQSADDFHRITVAFKKIYGAKWVNTGASKGGMTSIYHRRFYPEDLDGTVADVAPLSFTNADQRYNQFIDNVGGEKWRECRGRLKQFQIQLLEKRGQLETFFNGNFSHLGGRSIAFEHAVIEMPFYFWQYGNPNDTTNGCSGIPTTDDHLDMIKFLVSHSSVDSYTDEGILPFLPYYYQAATQLGGPDNLTVHLETFRQFTVTINQYTPKNVPISYSNESMRDVSQWVKTSADKVLFVYGELDPWSAGEFPVSQTGKIVVKLFAPGANHSANFRALNPDDRKIAIAMISSWLGKAPAPFQVDLGSTLEDAEFLVRKTYLRR